MGNGPSFLSSAIQAAIRFQNVGCISAASGEFITDRRAGDWPCSTKAYIDVSFACR